VSFYAAYLVAAMVAVGLLWLRHQAGVWIVTAASVFTLIAVAIPALALSLKQWGFRLPRAWLDRLPGVAAILSRIAATPIGFGSRKGLLVLSLLLQACVFVLDATTLWVAFHALGQAVPFPTAFVGFMFASIVATIGPVPAGLGTFEASAVGVLSLLGIDVETALAATLLLRGLTFWFPMLPGMFFARRELDAHAPEH
jgi:uncharacterized protein (TIRG00374 family)